MRTPTLTIVVPTAGRPTLERCLDSIPETITMDNIGVLVVEDIHAIQYRQEGYLSTKEIQELCIERGIGYECFNAGYHDWGYPQLDFAYRHCVFGDYIMNIGDDDIMLEGAIVQIMDIINHNGIQPYMFQAELMPSSHRGNEEPVILWNDESRDIKRKSVTGQNLVVPNIPHLMGQMTDDFEFIRSTIERWHGLVQWVPLVITRCF